jgi:hypothetical protein
MRRRKLLVALAGLTVLAAGTIVLWPRPDRITRENYRRIQIAMSLAEVEAILGPEGDYTTAPVGPTLVLDFLSDESPVPVPFICTWYGDSAAIRLGFDKQAKILWGQYQGQVAEKQGALENLLWRIKRQCRKWFT